MALSAQLWSLNALSIELGMDRRTLGKKLSNLEPAEEKDFGTRTEKKWYLADVMKHLRVTGYSRSTASAGDVLDYMEEHMLDDIKQFIAGDFIPKTLNNSGFINILINGMKEEAGVTIEQALFSYKLACLALVHAIADGFNDPDMDFNLCGYFQELGEVGDQAFIEKYFPNRSKAN